MDLPKWARRLDCSNAAIIERCRIDGPVCHLGAKINKDGADDEMVERWRRSFDPPAKSGFVGVDLFDGYNVDIVADICAEGYAIKHPDLLGRFGLVVCRALLEHVPNPFAAAGNIIRLIKPGGHLYYNGPWVWGFHPYPSDYWRISFEALKVLFPALIWKEWWYSGTNDQVAIAIDRPELERKIFAQPTTAGLSTMITDRGMPYLNIGAVGQLVTPHM
jgi:SAM-dependent methyltransferase